MESERANEQSRNDRAASLENYLEMEEHEKDAEIHKAVIRLQKRIQQILYTLETERDVAGSLPQETSRRRE